MDTMKHLPRADEFVQLLRERLPDKTFQHCLSTAQFMRKVAEHTSLDSDDAATAGLLHDLAKGMDDEELLEAADQFGIEVSDVQRARPKLLHGPVAAAECRRLGLEEAICEAVEWHTTGRPGLNALGLALYFADYAEPLRDFADAHQARNLLEEESFETALRYTADAKWQRLLSKKHPIDPVTREFHQWLRKEVLAESP